MKTIERVFQAIFFEVSTLAIVVPVSVLIGGFETGKMAIVGIGLSLFAMVWNYVYNIVFDKCVGNNRVARGMAIRMTHAIGFELGMVVITLPVLAWFLDITWLAATILEAGFLIFILFYTLLFNWLYDRYQPYQKWFSKTQYI